MLHRNTEKLYPTCGSQKKLSDDFADFFITKITKIRSEMTVDTVPDPNSYSVDSTTTFSEFIPVTEQQLAKLISNTASKSCSLDPVPAVVLKNCFDLLLPVFTKIVNLSLVSCTVPSCLKVAVLDPRLKNPVWTMKSLATSGLYPT